MSPILNGRKLSRRLLRLCKFIGTGSFTLLLAACYGVSYLMEDDISEVERDFTLTLKDEDNLPIPGLALYMRENDHISSTIGYTPPEGINLRFTCPISEDLRNNAYDLEIRDEDGAHNGGYYGSKVIPLSINPDESQTTAIQTVVLSPDRKFVLLVRDGETLLPIPGLKVYIFREEETPDFSLNPPYGLTDDSGVLTLTITAYDPQVTYRIFLVDGDGEDNGGAFGTEFRRIEPASEDCGFITHVHIELTPAE